MNVVVVVTRRCVSDLMHQKVTGPKRGGILLDRRVKLMISLKQNGRNVARNNPSTRNENPLHT